MATAMLSSPDPLNDTPTFQAPPQTRHSSRIRSSMPSQGSSPKKQVFNLDVGNQLSPQKIKVTVEAGSSDAENHRVRRSRNSSPSKPRATRNRRRERTITTTVPVKGLSDSEDDNARAASPKRGRGRPRKSIGSPATAKKTARALTPNRNPYTCRKSVDNSIVDEAEEYVNLPIGKSIEIGRGKGGSRSRSRKAVTRKSTPTSKHASSDRVVSSTASKRGRRKTLLPEDVAVLEDVRNATGEEEARVPLEMSRALQAIEVNEAYGATKTPENHILDWFVPDNGPSSGENRSSSKEFETQRSSSPRLRYSAQEGEKSQLIQCDDSLALISPPTSESHPREAPQVEDGIREDEMQDPVGEMRELDTILESEGFSMISVDSVPSLREHLSSPADQVHREGRKKTSTNKNMLTTQNESYDDSFSAIPEEILEAATPARKAPNPHLLSIQNARVDDTFSSIPPEILEAATPAPKSQVSKFLSRDDTRKGGSSSKRSCGSMFTLPDPNASEEQHENYEDSFSAVPEEILKAATPAPAPKTVLHPTEPQESSSSGPKVPSLKLSASRSIKSLSPALLTPEETPSPYLEQRKEEEPLSSEMQTDGPAGQTIEKFAEDNSSVIDHHMPSSPPSIAPRRYTYTQHLRNYHQLHPESIRTPSIVFSSPSLPPPLPQHREEATSGSSQNSQRPALSPVTRAGKALQNIDVPSSPRNRSQSLGSPFKSPVSERRSSSIAREQLPPAQERFSNQLPKVDLHADLTALSSEHSGSTHLDKSVDPFSYRNDGSDRRPRMLAEKQSYSLGIPSERHSGISSSRLATLRSEPDTARSEDGMSWQAEDEVILSSNSTFLEKNNINSSGGDRTLSVQTTSSVSCEQEDVVKRAAIGQRIEVVPANEVIVISSDHTDTKSGQDEEDESFQLLIETINSSSPVAEERFEPVKEAVEKPRRSKLPSPWRNDSKRVVCSDELSKLSSPRPPIRSVRRFAADNITSKPDTMRRVVDNNHQQSDDTADLDLSSWHIPQKSNFQPRPRESVDLDLSALLSRSPDKKLPVLTSSSRDFSSRLESRSRHALSSQQPSSVLNDISSEEQEEPFALIAQKQGFAPRSRSELSSSPVRQPAFGLFGSISRGPAIINNRPLSSSTSQPLAPSSQNKCNVSPQALYPAHQLPEPTVLDESNTSILSNAEKENQTRERTLKWTKNVPLASTPSNESPKVSLQIPAPASSSSIESQRLSLTSPTKSILRSPLKTPQVASTTSHLSPSKAVAFVSSSPLPLSPAVTLSPTIWSRAHWSLLDKILQRWKPESNDSPISSSTYDHRDAAGRKRRNSTKVISRLLGRTVTDKEGRSMEMQQWHLEAVDEFRGQIDGWAEKEVAMRVFALLIGEEKRRNGYVSSLSSVRKEEGVKV